MRHRPARSRIPIGAVAAALLLATLSPTAPTASGQAEPAAETLGVDLATSTGAFRGGATGILYGLGDPGVPSRDLIAGMKPRTIAQKPPDGEQHPNGDAVVVADDFFASGGSDVYINSQDIYSAWPYQDLGIDDYIARLKPQLEKVAARPDRDRFVWTIFNEPDWIWYGDWATKKDRFLADWTKVYRTVKSVLPNARIDGPGEASYNPGRLRDFLAYAKANDVLPDIVTWHELSPDSLNHYRAHYEDYRDIEKSLGIGPLPINITEYTNRRDTSVPGQLIQWITMLEDTKVDGQMAYWSLAGNLSDQAVRTSRANGGWWLTKWYADLSGDTVRVTPPRPSARDSLQGLATLDRDDAEATVLLGGTANPVDVAVSGLDRRVFGDHVDVRVAKTTWSGYEGDAGQPPVVAASRVRVSDGKITVKVPGGDRLAAYQVIVTPAGLAPAPVANAPWTSRHEAESGLVENAVVVDQADPSGWRYTTSGGKDVGYMNNAGSRVTVEVDVPRTGAYRLGVLYGTGGFVGRQALYVDDVHVSTLTFPATLNWQYRGRLDAPVQLTAGRHRVSLRTSDPTGFLGRPSDIALDRIDLTEVTGPERATYQLTDSRRSGGSVDRGVRALRALVPNAVVLRPGDAVTTYVSAAEDGYYSLSTTWFGAGRSTLGLALSGRRVTGGDLTADRAGAWTGSTTVHLKAGVTEAVLSNEGRTPMVVGTLTQVRDPGTDRRAVRVEAEAGQLDGGAMTASGPWASGGSYVGQLGNGGTMTVARPDGVRAAGQYNLTVAYAQAEKNTGHPYNTDAVTRFLDAAEAGGGTTRAPYRHNYTWDGFWAETSPLDLTTTGGAVTFGNATGWGPNVDWVQLAPLVAANSVTSRH
ncbi:carbohydrate binding protein with CBM6 domain [Saccharothrix carnea]|uniref:Carbohydrate binding protein with CBM6 domain n=1 Tax=Saccharothrix carnea TaxID=1280637 RepID=A0A2P8I0I4_SACCR|nr:carbohydrate-binding protein [Saccharothrix carnea]PSL51971.1 carbohydrate binding protein with CBM6 domain [Saccharothrix carnea]